MKRAKKIFSVELKRFLKSDIRYKQDFQGALVVADGTISAKHDEEKLFLEDKFISRYPIIVDMEIDGETWNYVFDIIGQDDDVFDVKLNTDYPKP